MNQHPTVSQEQWIAARKELLNKEKELAHLQDEVSRQRRELPWVKVEKEYIFETPEGRKTLSELFNGNSQLVVYHFMFGPGWKAGCVGCSFFSDHVDGANQHLAHHDVTFTAVSRAPLAEIEAYKKRMGWRFNWVSSSESDFNYDFHVSFRKEAMRGEVYYNYEMLKTTWRICTVRVCSSRTTAGQFFIPIPPMRAGTSADSALTCSSISRQRVAMRPAPTST